MPFTPFHFGPALALGLLFKRRWHAPTFIIANMIVDLEPLLVIFLGLDYPLHGYLHTFILASFLGCLLGCAMFLLEGIFHQIWKVLLLEDGDRRLRVTSFMISGALGMIFHVFLDSPLYDDIKPLYPIFTNPFYNPSLSLEIYSFCVLIGIVALAYYLRLILIAKYKT
ncbi:MAG: hydrolase [Candidatus Bathyarchaeia archaeon]